jgi:hypothetical protein
LQLQKQLSNIGANKQLFANKNQEAQIKQAMLSMLSSQVASQKARGAQQQQAGVYLGEPL